MNTSSNAMCACYHPSHISRKLRACVWRIIKIQYVCIVD